MSSAMAKRNMLGTRDELVLEFIGGFARLAVIPASASVVRNVDFILLGRRSQTSSLVVQILLADVFDNFLLVNIEPF